MNNLIDRLSKCYASAIHDVLREKGYGNCVLPPEIQALEKGQNCLERFIQFRVISIIVYPAMNLYYFGLKFYPKSLLKK